MKTRLLLSIAFVAVMAGGCGASEAPLVVSEVEITRSLPGHSMSAGYFLSLIHI